MKTGIYQITNTVNGNCYIGQASNIHSRIYSHIYDLEKQQHKNRHLQNAWNKHGKESFISSVLLYCEKSELTRYEQGLVDAFQPEYNICKKCVKSHIGVKRSDETKRKCSESRKGRKLSEEQIKKFSKSMMGHVVTKDTRKKISDAQKGYKPTPETIKKLSESHKGQKAWNIGLKNSEETRKKISKNRKGVQKTLESIRITAEKNKGQKRSEEVKQKMRNAQALRKLKKSNLEKENHV